MPLNTYLNFAGRCVEAFHYYEKHLGGKIEMMMTFDQGPKEVAVAPELKGSILHAKMTIAGTELMGADIPKANRCVVPTCRSAWTAMPKPSAFSKLSWKAARPLCPCRRPFSQPDSVRHGISSECSG
jgi:uncharacterized glyoxalase superfamily protein PhnB